SYPSLFPNGSTFFTKPRIRPVTFSGWVRHLLQMHDDRFRTHYDFILAVYNQVQRLKVIEATRYEISGYPTSGVKPETLLEQLGRVERNLPITDNAVRSLLNRVRTCGSLITHSPQRKVILRSHIFSLINKYGWPSYFITLNPADLN
ncbi:hypothetical protein BC833DRAFT_508383, partial [Globomyces pollinis-pini]